MRIANYLCNGNYAVSGGEDGCQAVQELAKSKGARMTVKLAVAGAFHTAYMQPAQEELQYAPPRPYCCCPRAHHIVPNCLPSNRPAAQDVCETVYEMLTRSFLLLQKCSLLLQPRSQAAWNPFLGHDAHARALTYPICCCCIGRLYVCEVVLQGCIGQDQHS